MPAGERERPRHKHGDAMSDRDTLVFLCVMAIVLVLLIAF
jgi:hypothetical protein